MSILSTTIPTFIISRMHQQHVDMPTTKKRKIEHTTLEPAEYVQQYCQRRGLPRQTGTSQLERECQTLAQEAREEFKQQRDQLANAQSLDRKGLSPAEKYTIRLHNNRKSAEASKVYNEILKIEQAYRLANLSQHVLNSVKPSQYHHNQRVIDQLNKQVNDLKSEKNRLNGALTFERERSERYKKQVQQLQQQQLSLRSQPIPLHPPVQNTPSQSQQNENPDSLPDSAPQSLHERLVNSRSIIPSWTFSPPADPDVNVNQKIHTGLTCTQSQPDESEDKPLMRGPATSMPLNLLGSQPSQDNPYKAALGSEDLPLPPGSDFFVGSQGTSKSRPS